MCPRYGLGFLVFGGFSGVFVLFFLVILEISQDKKGHINYSAYGKEASASGKFQCGILG